MSSNHTQRFFELSMDMLCVANMEGYFVTVNPAFQNTLGYSFDELTKKPFLDFVHPDDRDSTLKEMTKLDAGHATLHFVNRYLCKDGTYKYLSWTTCPATDDRYLYAVARDITDRKQSEENLKKINLELESSVKQRTIELEEAIQLRDKFISIVSHELKNPLTALKLRLQMRKRYALNKKFFSFSPDELADLFKDDEKQVDTLTRLVDDLIDVTRIRSGRLSLKVEEADFCKIVQEVVKEFELKMSEDDEAKKIHIKFSPCTPMWGAWDADRIRQVVSNLISNALKYGDGNPIEVQLESNSNLVKLKVLDHGLGIDEKDQGRVFELFERVSVSSAKGLGVGLYIVQQIVEAHGGKITLVSEKGSGACFLVEFPVRSLSKVNYSQAPLNC